MVGVSCLKGLEPVAHSMRERHSTVVCGCQLGCASRYACWVPPLLTPTFPQGLGRPPALFPSVSLQLSSLTSDKSIQPIDIHCNRKVIDICKKKLLAVYFLSERRHG